jgi:hypothetical protein
VELVEIAQHRLLNFPFVRLQQPEVGTAGERSGISRPALLRGLICGQLNSHRPPSWEPMMKSTLELQLQLLGPADWRVLRAARLRALLDAPCAFTSRATLASPPGASQNGAAYSTPPAALLLARPKGRRSGKVNR